MLTQQAIIDFCNQYDYDIRKSGNGRWIDQKCAADVVTVIADCVYNYALEDDDGIFTTADIWHYKYAVESGSVSTNETVRVIDSLYGNIKEGEKISVFKMGGYVKIQDYINSYEEEFREQVKNSATFENLTEDDIQNKYISFLPEGGVKQI